MSDPRPDRTAITVRLQYLGEHIWRPYLAAVDCLSRGDPRG
eukprot:gene7706-10644_t